MDATRIDTYLGVPMPSALEEPDEQDKSRTVLYAALDDLTGSSGQLEFHLGTGVITPEIRLLKDDDREALVKRRLFRRKHLERCEILVVSAAVPISFLDGVSSSHTDVDRGNVGRFLAQLEFCKRVSDLLVMSNVSRVGAVEVLHTLVLQDGEPLDFSHIPTMAGLSLRDAARAAECMNWPRLETVAIQDTWRWYVKRRDMLDGFDGTSMGRALCAFSRLFEHTTQDEPMQLLWALVGLESLYGQGQSGLAQQLRDKAQAFLGKQVDFKKKVTDMYHFRSRFVHGDLDFPGLCLLGDARDTVARFDGDLLDAIAVAVALLAATLQEVIRRDWDGLTFDYTVNNMSMSS
jgi:hypothetical protein